MVASVDAVIDRASAGTLGLGDVPDAARKAATVGLGATAEASFSTEFANAGSGRLATVPSSATRAVAPGGTARPCV
jgi:hypothetical protein